MTAPDHPQLRDLLAQAASRLPGDEARHEAERLLLHALRRPRSWLFAHATDAVDAADRTTFDALLARRLAGEPVAYITGQRDFWTLQLEVDPATRSRSARVWRNAAFSSSSHAASNTVRSRPTRRMFC